MCLYKTHWLPKISRKPIQVYKVFIKKTNGDELTTPYQKQVCKVGETIKSKNSWLKGIFNDKIKGEGVHAFVCKYNADLFALCNVFRYVYICEIPPFTPYWISDDEIAATKMVIKKMTSR